MSRQSVATDNPIRKLRLQHHKSLRQLSHECGVNIQALYLNECGVYSHILPVVKKKLVKKYHADGQKLDQEYRMFISQKRFFFDRDFSATLPENNGKNPVVSLRENLSLSRLGFAKVICVHPSILHKVEKNVLSDIPESLRIALLQCGFRVEDVRELSDRYRKQR